MWRAAARYGIVKRCSGRAVSCKRPRWSRAECEAFVRKLASDYDGSEFWSVRSCEFMDLETIRVMRCSNLATFDW